MRSPSTQDQVRVLSATGQLGYGMPEEAFRRGLDARPDIIGCDLGSIDPGPFALGSGFDPRSQMVVERDLRLVLEGGAALGVPVILGSAGLAGTDAEVDVVADQVRSITLSAGRTIRMVTIKSEVTSDWAVSKFKAGVMRPVAGSPEPTLDQVLSCTHIVAQMGVEPFVNALRAGADVIVAGRACDTSIFAALPILQGFDHGLTYHMAKIVECASQCAEPGGRDAIMGVVYHDHFTVESMNPNRRCTPRSVAAHSLYEQENPFRTVEPGGTVDISDANFLATSDRITAVKGSRWEPAEEYTLKLEGASLAGYRTFAIGGVRDPILLAKLPEVVRAVESQVAEVMSTTDARDRYTLNFTTYGHNAVLGAREMEPFSGHEAAVLIDVVAENQEAANAVCSTARQYLLHYFYPSIRGTAGNLAFRYSPSEHDAGEVYRFSVYHTVPSDPLDVFSTSIEDIGDGDL